MSKYQEALSNYFTAKLQFDNEMYKSMELLEELVDTYPEYLKLKAKATPKKVVNWLRDKSMACCPYCSSAGYSEEKHKYCYYCGQAILWEE